MCDLLLELTGVKHKVTSAYHPQTERMNQTLKGSLIQVVNNRQDDWDQHLDKILFSYQYVFVGELLLDYTQLLRKREKKKKKKKNTHTQNIFSPCPLNAET